ncbi:MAG: hypothetical protein GQ564_21000 [Bacteroidales bacterium]|nr:hypothetical protein [Bacteroidales bacterium]
MHISITKEQFVKFILNDVNEEERQNIIEAINTNSVTKERYLLEKRKYDVERYVNDEIDIGEACEIEELIKMDSRLYDHFEMNTEAIEEEDQDELINLNQIPITNGELIKFILNDVYEKEHKKISEAINTNSLTKERYLFEKRKYDVERYLDDEMDFGEACEFEEVLKINSRLHDYFELKKGVNEEEKQNASINLKNIPITNEQLVNFVLNDVNDEEREKISEAINTKSLIKERYLYEKRKYDVERYIDDEMNIGERCEIEELIKMNSDLFDHFELNNGVIEEEQDGSNHQQITITEEQLVNFVLNDVTEDEHKKISEAINTNPVTKERFLYEKRKYDVERYLNDEMDIGERCEIEELLQINSRLYEHFELNNGVNEFLQIALREQINNIHAELYDAIHNNEADKIEDEVSPVKDTTPVIELKHNVLRIGKWVAAASIVLMISTYGMMYFTSNQNTIDEKLYNKYYEPFRPNATNFFNSSTLIKAKNKYNNQEYDIAWLLIEKLPGSMTIESEKTLYAGLTLMELERYSNAIDKFELLQANEEKAVTYSISQWYLALCYLNTERRTDATEILKDIVANKSYNYSDAKKILKKLN